ncbi:MAG TPA: hypothetical protein VE621_21640 [Bryobacteraceae bacterium]|jgi:hypothetical protein|nr:hypothetical protein [Bryobacteraceae bacterium]
MQSRQAHPLARAAAEKYGLGKRALREWLTTARRLPAINGVGAIDSAGRGTDHIQSVSTVDQQSVD